MSLVAALSLVIGLGGPGLAQQNNVAFSGQATVVRGTVLGAQVTIVDTGPLPPSGGALEASLLTATVPDVLSAKVLHAATVGQGDRSRSEASVANFNLTVTKTTISADFLMARAQAVCTKKGPVVSGSSEIVALTINGTAIDVSGKPNQTIALPNGKVIINEQVAKVANGKGEITVNALHVILNDLTDVVISSAHADVICGQVICDGSDLVTGGGFITTSTRARANFAVAGGLHDGASWGHLNYIDHGTAMHVQGTSVTDYEVVTATTRRISGTCKIDGKTGFTYIAEVADNGEPGRKDTFALKLSNGYEAGNKLAGGNIQLHKPKPCN